MAEVKVVRAERVNISQGVAPGSPALVTFDWDGKLYSKEIQPLAWGRVWARFGGPDVPNDKIKALAEQWLGNALRRDDLSAQVFDVAWVSDRLPASNVA